MVSPSTRRVKSDIYSWATGEYLSISYGMAAINEAMDVFKPGRESDYSH
jgi:hypothetical protein